MEGLLPMTRSRGPQSPSARTRTSGIAIFVSQWQSICGEMAILAG